MKDEALVSELKGMDGQNVKGETLDLAVFKYPESVSGKIKMEEEKSLEAKSRKSFRIACSTPRQTEPIPDGVGSNSSPRGLRSYSRREGGKSKTRNKTRLKQKQAAEAPVSLRNH